VCLGFCVQLLSVEDVEKILDDTQEAVEYQQVGITFIVLLALLRESKNQATVLLSTYCNFFAECASEKKFKNKLMYVGFFHDVVCIYFTVIYVGVMW